MGKTPVVSDENIHKDSFGLKPWNHELNVSKRKYHITHYLMQKQFQCKQFKEIFLLLCNFEETDGISNILRI